LEELQGLQVAAAAVPDSFQGKVVLTVGATPTATAAQNFISSSTPKAAEARAMIEELRGRCFVELHAGVYPLLDLQQVATHARPSSLPPSEAQTPGFEPLSKDNIALRMLVEVTSIYDERSKPEALISAGSLALGREPCKSYPGWGIVAPDTALGTASSLGKIYDERGARTGWIVGRVSQEHGILTWEGPREQCSPLAVGQKLLVWPNHACVAGAGFGWYFVFDSEMGGDRVVDVWVRWRGW
jgi:D-serine deaminase-like pyridoxal phosphate-dependent protein